MALRLKLLAQRMIKSSQPALIQTRLFSASSIAAQKKVAVILSGCGVYDGSEINEASAVLVHLTRNNLKPICYGPDKEQLHTINHNEGVPIEGDRRNALVESSRITRGNCYSLSKLHAADVDALILPGGFGVAKNLSDFALKGTEMTVDKEVERVFREFHVSKKPIALCCIAPILAAKLFPKVSLTLGCNDTASGKWPHAGAIEAAKSMGAILVDKKVHEVHIDHENLVLSTPCFMYEGEMYEIFDGVGALVKELMEYIK